MSKGIKMNNENIIILNLSDVSLLQEALRNYCGTKLIVTENFQNQVHSTLRKLYSIEISLKNSSSKELYIQKQ